MALVLASKSPRRKQLMHLLAPSFTVYETDVIETIDEGIPPAKAALQIAKLKAQNAAQHNPGQTIIGCDTVVELAGEILGKPKNKEQVISMLTSLRAKRHWVHTGVWVIAPNAPARGICETTAVDFEYIQDEEIAAYANTGEAYDKAGGYGVQGWAARYIARIEGCYYNVMGLPIAALGKLLQNMEVS